MRTVQWLIFSAASFGSGFGYAAAGDPCYDLYVGAYQYSEDDWVSANVLELDPCSNGDRGCIDGYKTVARRFNFQCISNAWCSNSGYYPGGIYTTLAWSQSAAACDATATAATVPRPAVWSFGGCPEAYSPDTDYFAGDAVSVEKSTYTQVYTCNAEPNDQFCGQGLRAGPGGYEPGASLYWEQAWTLEGSCSGSLSPTDSPLFMSLADAGGCPDVYVSGATYEEGDKVAKDGLVFECKGFPFSMHCSQAGYEPLVASGHFEAWNDAWAIVGYCSGTITPTFSPSYLALEDMGACPADWEITTYEEGDKVASNGLVFSCNSYPQGRHCGQAGYEPLVASVHGEAWEDAWALQGYCSGSTGPTSSPSFDTVDHVGRCPEAWEAGDNVKYEEGDMVSIVVSQDPIRMVAYSCRGWPYSGHCGQFSPDNKDGGKLGWTLAGTCGKSDGGTYGPTMSPLFDPLSIISACPEEWGANGLDYDDGDQVSVAISTSPERKMIYQCRAWPNSGYCSQAGYKPYESSVGTLAWKLIGTCDGSFAPTASPASYTGTCTYEKCRIEDVSVGCTPGSWGCVCPVGTSSETSCKKTVQESKCITKEVDVWSQQIYMTGDVVRLDTEKFTCRTWPNYLWCRQEAYKPTSEEGIWSDAWTKSGKCLTVLTSKSPTTSPSKSPMVPSISPTGSPTSPTKSPTGSPTSSPSKSPTGSPTSSPSKSPTGSPTSSPSKSPTGSPTSSPSKSPTLSPSKSPTSSPSKSPTGSTTSPSGSPTLRPRKITAGDATGDELFGSSVAMYGNTIVVGAYEDDDNAGNSGSVYIYELDTNTNDWEEKQKLVASDPESYGYFGRCVSIHDNTVVVGAPQSNGGLGSKSGSVYIYVRNPTDGSWSLEQKVTADDAESFDYFGLSVSIHDNTVVVGAYGDNGSSDNGSAYIYVRATGASDWNQEYKLLASDAAAGDNFGKSVAIYGNTVVVGAEGDDDNGFNASGSAYIYVRDPGSTVWRQEQKVTANDAAASDNFGFSVAIYDNTVVVGAYKDDGGELDHGSAYIYVRAAGSTEWNEEKKLVATDGEKYDQFGRHVAIYGNTVVVGAHQNDDKASNTGAAYIYVRDTGSTVWRQEQKLVADDAERNDNFGVSVAIYDNSVVVGSYRDDDNGSSSGSAYVFSGL